jgi:hypothetical protein
VALRRLVVGGAAREREPVVDARIDFDLASSNIARILVPESGQPSWRAAVLPPDM